MASIGKVALTAFSAAQETSLGLIQGHFDFSLVKIEAPVEYRGLGLHLSPNRRSEAEDGATHAVARKLGALFSDVTPHVPSLKQAYGLRTSEIAGDPAHNPLGSSAAHGPLRGLVGADGTSIWAAATSGPGALEAHLLACLLARAFSGEEATAIWAELVKTRQAVLQSQLDEGKFLPSTAFLARIDISREMLAVWDASARAWLRTADKAKVSQQTQLLRIVEEDLGLSLPSHSQMYNSIMESWFESMKVMDQLVRGVACQISKPEVILGLCSWHIYPDMSVASQTPTFVKQSDSLVRQGGVLTLGIQSLNREAAGLSWSVLLHHLRFYGKPERSTGGVDLSSTRIPIDRLVLIALGSATYTWGQDFGDIDKTFQLINTLAARHAAELADNPGTFRFMRWILIFGQQAQQYLCATDVEKKEIKQFINFGRRRCRSFLVSPPQQVPLAFGLGSFDNLLGLLNVEGQIKLLRYIAKTYDLGLNLDTAVIRYQPTGVDEIVKMHLPVEYTNLTENRQPGCPAFRRWLTLPRFRVDALSADNFLFPNSTPHSDRPSRGFDRSLEVVARRSVIIMERLREPCAFFLNSDIIEDVKDSGKFMWPATETPIQSILGDLRMIAADVLAKRSQAAAATGSTDTISATPDSILLEVFSRGWQLGASPHPHGNKTYRYLFGSVRVKVYQPDQSYQPLTGRPTYSLITKVLSELPNGRGRTPLRRLFCPRGILDHGKFVDAASLGLPTANDFDYASPWLKQFMTSMHVLGSGIEVYNHLPSALVDMKITTTPLYLAKWADPDLRRTMQVLSQDPDLEPNTSDLATVRHFSCIALFDTGHINLHPTHFVNAMAISSGDSLYVSEKLLSDPSVAFSSPAAPVRHLIGNIGKPGLSVLGWVKEPMMLEPSLNTWRLVNHADWDGTTIADSFATTTLQLSLTGHEMTLNLSRPGGHYREATYLEARLSAYDAGSWMADVEVMQQQQQQQQQQGGRVLPAGCGHGERERADSADYGTIAVVDNWFEVLDAPLGSAVVRATGNWMARLALGSVLQTNDEPFVVCSAGGAGICWGCVKERVEGPRVVVLC
ncbi:hypothetical protein B0T17DRAFT_511795 [Bombardia bombarda]|uniref:Uncharacterized protein n=1 Tax=Bombardia bombarda TaxID=252184 RepID=A0AA39U542_9PEZI|nr:hypothetical protein B0T17DRAFT_511795 [Bombardia bombarda]